MNCSKMIGLTLVFWGYLKTKRKVDIFSVYEKFFSYSWQIYTLYNLLVYLHYFTKSTV